ncbi:hypothetical protein E4U43_001513 [Claviceps pusilla]|uniref:Zn(2)-C6 fungal-type domain-containing protein n=1 Tax=Claviceps pusilla TaxID=123648 RepID=A0A9P7N869_9HYPO|nr:hypothetical protein E4U43_001513 [Claviceps pusilla]
MPAEARRQLLPRPAFIPPPGPEQQPPAPSPRAGKRKSVANACERCRKRKIKCNGQLPRCAPCLTASAECKYMSRGSALNRRHVALQESYGHLKSAIELLCTGTEMDAVNSLRMLRTGQSRENLLSLLYHHPDPKRWPSLLPELPWALINAILAYALASFSSADDGQTVLKSRDFAQEANRLLNLQPQAKTVAFFQATAIMSVHEHAFGDHNMKVLSEPLIDMQSVNMEHILPTDAQRRAKVREALLFIQSGLYELNV